MTFLPAWSPLDVAGLERYNAPNLSRMNGINLEHSGGRRLQGVCVHCGRGGDAREVAGVATDLGIREGLPV